MPCPMFLDPLPVAPQDVVRSRQTAILPKMVASLPSGNDRRKSVGAQIDFGFGWCRQNPSQTRLSRNAERPRQIRQRIIPRQPVPA